MERLGREGASREFMVDAAHTRMRSAATREAAMTTGQLPYGLRSLRRPPADEEMDDG